MIDTFGKLGITVLGADNSTSAQP
ncbi:hypothetical protein [Histophilus somni]